MIPGSNPTDDSSPHDDKWLLDMSRFLSTGFPPPWMRTDEKKRLVVRSRNFCLVGDTPYHKGNDDIWRWCVRNDEKDIVLREAHCEIAGGHYARDATARKI